MRFIAREVRMRIEWTKDLSTAIPEIDEQHKELLSRINCLLDACDNDRGGEEIGRTIGFLEDYVVTHFGTEEQLMAATAYPRAARHTEEHKIFISRIADLKHKFHYEGAEPDIVQSMASALTAWLNSHIRGTDRALGEYLRNKNIGTSGAETNR